jgi:hypothetical protein
LDRKEVEMTALAADLTAQMAKVAELETEKAATDDAMVKEIATSASMQLHLDAVNNQIAALTQSLVDGDQGDTVPKEVLAASVARENERETMEAQLVI